MARLTIVHRHFWPSDLPYSMMLREFALRAKINSFEVNVVSPVQSTADQTRREEWSRESGISTVSKVMPSAQGSNLLSKATLYIRYLLWIAIVLLREKTDVIWVATTPPVVAAALVRYICSFKRCGYVYHVQDIHPEASTAIGKVEKGMLYRLLLRIDETNVRSAACVVTLSADMKATLMRRGVDGENIVVINNFVRSNIASIGDKDIQENSEDSRPKSNNRWIFAGTIGHFQNIELFLDAILLIAPACRPHVTLVGAGSLKHKLMQKYDGSREFIEFMEPVDSATAQQIMSEHAVGIVSLEEGVIECAYPSKLGNYLAAGLKIVAAVSKQSDLARLLELESLGYAADAQDAPTLARDLEKAILDGKLEEDRMASIEASQRNFSADVVLGAYVDVLQSIKLQQDEVIGS